MCRLSFPDHVWRGSEREAVTLSLYQIKKMSNQVVPTVQTQVPAGVKPDAVQFQIVDGFAVAISATTHRLVRPLEANKAGTIRVGFLPVKSKAAANDICRELKCGQAEAKKALRRAKRELGQAWAASMTAGLNSTLLFRAGTVGKSGAVGVVFDSDDADDSMAVASAEERAVAAEAKLAAMEARLAELSTPAKA